MNSLTSESIVSQIENVLSQIQKVDEGEFGFVGEDAWQKLNKNIMLVRAAIERLTPLGSSYRKNLELLLKGANLTDYGTLKNISNAAVGQLQAFQADVSKGYIVTLAELIHAELFGDFMEMAYFLLKSGFNLPSAVIIGSVLEENLRKLCLKHGIHVTKEKGEDEVPLSASALSTELYKAEIYTALVQKQVVVWQDIRNQAAHGHTDKFSQADVEAMYRDVLRFLTEYPA